VRGEEGAGGEVTSDLLSRDSKGFKAASDVELQPICFFRFRKNWREPDVWTPYCHWLVVALLSAVRFRHRTPSCDRQSSCCRPLLPPIFVHRRHCRRCRCCRSATATTATIARPFVVPLSHPLIILSPQKCLVCQLTTCKNGSSGDQQISHALLWLGVEDALLDLVRGAEVLHENIAPCALAKAEGPRLHHHRCQNYDNSTIR
jgi:hypothetical protein